VGEARTRPAHEAPGRPILHGDTSPVAVKDFVFDTLDSVSGFRLVWYMDARRLQALWRPGELWILV